MRNNVSQWDLYYTLPLWTVKTLLGQQIIAIICETKYIYDMSYIIVEL